MPRGSSANGLSDPRPPPPSPAPPIPSHRAPLKTPAPHEVQAPSRHCTPLGLARAPSLLHLIMSPPHSTRTEEPHSVPRPGPLTSAGRSVLIPCSPCSACCPGRPVSPKPRSHPPPVHPGRAGVPTCCCFRGRMSFAPLPQTASSPEVGTAPPISACGTPTWSCVRTAMLDKPAMLGEEFRKPGRSRCPIGTLPLPPTSPVQ